MKICPNPQPWNEVHKKLDRYSKKNTCTPSEPPIPLILDGWWYSSDMEKKIRWEEMVEWAKDNRCTEILDSIQDDDFYYI